MAIRQFTHMPVGQEVEAIAGHYLVDKEVKIEIGEREILCVLGTATIDKACCGTGGCRYALVPGYLVSYKDKHSKEGQPVSEVELITDDKERKQIEAKIRSMEFVQQVNFW